MPKPKIAKDTPLAEITLRKYEHPKNLQGRELVRKLCLSIGLLNPGDSRDILVDIFLVLLKSKADGPLSLEQIREKVIEERKKGRLTMLGIAPSNLRRQLKRLRDLFLAERLPQGYRIAETATLAELFREKIEPLILQNTLERVKEYLEAWDKP
ncbi:hypothetical protein HYV84_03545 [Candidatus Woesearchaeota archaeon]|nr:hypothetical protein [Candidatus Woesearchaeota archaeon]